MVGSRHPLYRDACVGLRARIAEREIRIREREAELTEAFWTSLEPYVRERLAELREDFMRRVLGLPLSTVERAQAGTRSRARAPVWSFEDARTLRSSISVTHVR